MEYSKTFVPWLYMFVKTENQTAYTTMFKAAKHFAALFFEIELNVSFGSLDCTALIANAFTDVWPGIKLLNCYPHLARKCVEKAPKLLQVRCQLRFVSFLYVGLF